MPPHHHPAPHAVNHLTRRWSRTVDPAHGTVFAAPGLWPLLALLASGATGPAREELEEALGLPAADAAPAARELLAHLRTVPGLGAALGVWTGHGVPVRPEWAAGLPEGTHGTLTGDPDTDRAALAAWAHAHTDGLADAPPTGPAADLRMLLASAVSLRTTWTEPFQETRFRTTDGPWAGRDWHGLFRRTPRHDRVRVADTPAGPLTLARIGGDAGVDVHLVLGAPDARPGDVLAHGTAAATGALPSTTGDRFGTGSPGPGLTVSTVESPYPEPQLDLSTVAFGVRAEHDLLRPATPFGLDTARDARTGHFPGISTTPLAVGSARQNALAEFHALGFRAAAGTALAMVGAGLPKVRHRVRRVRADFDRPFGFLAVHRAGGLVLAAGWVAEPAPYPAEGVGRFRRRRVGPVTGRGLLPPRGPLAPR
ncbi:serpin family protein [Streptomyces sp. NRRL S-87]|uniref:serpin family protein n=1 Tax=Streptomyces sp. NRRL S-87 TaxID=1463920 RepID=UPI00099CCD34|nr:serpin family protein [Streptomyces sp. NRRL S-87]